PSLPSSFLVGPAQRHPHAAGHGRIRRRNLGRRAVAPPPSLLKLAELLPPSGREEVRPLDLPPEFAQLSVRPIQSLPHARFRCASSGRGVGAVRVVAVRTFARARSLVAAIGRRLPPRRSRPRSRLADLRLARLGGGAGAARSEPSRPSGLRVRRGRDEATPPLRLPPQPARFGLLVARFVAVVRGAVRRVAGRRTTTASSPLPLQRGPQSARLLGALFHRAHQVVPASFRARQAPAQIRDVEALEHQRRRSRGGASSSSSSLVARPGEVEEVHLLAVVAHADASFFFLGGEFGALVLVDDIALSFLLLALVVRPVVPLHHEGRPPLGLLRRQRRFGERPRRLLDRASHPHPEARGRPPRARGDVRRLAQPLPQCAIPRLPPLPREARFRPLAALPSGRDAGGVASVEVSGPEVGVRHRLGDQSSKADLEGRGIGSGLGGQEGGDLGGAGFDVEGREVPSRLVALDGFLVVEGVFPLVFVPLADVRADVAVEGGAGVVPAFERFVGREERLGEGLLQPGQPRGLDLLRGDVVVLVLVVAARAEERRGEPGKVEGDAALLLLLALLLLFVVVLTVLAAVVVVVGAFGSGFAFVLPAAATLALAHAQAPPPFLLLLVIVLPPPVGGGGVDEVAEVVPEGLPHVHRGRVAVAVAVFPVGRRIGLCCLGRRE
ncbi:hypothetical protein ACHAWF_003892, partial [Thalassiosira exigua]